LILRQCGLGRSSILWVPACGSYDGQKIPLAKETLKNKHFFVIIKSWA